MSYILKPPVGRNSVCPLIAYTAHPQNGGLRGGGENALVPNVHVPVVRFGSKNVCVHGTVRADPVYGSDGFSTERDLCGCAVVREWCNSSSGFDRTIFPDLAKAVVDTIFAVFSRIWISTVDAETQSSISLLGGGGGLSS